MPQVGSHALSLKDKACGSFNSITVAATTTVFSHYWLANYMVNDLIPSEPAWLIYPTRFGLWSVIGQIAMI